MVTEKRLDDQKQKESVFKANRAAMIGMSQKPTADPAGVRCWPNIKECVALFSRSSQESLNRFASFVTRVSCCSCLALAAETVSHVYQIESQDLVKVL